MNQTTLLSRLGNHPWASRVSVLEVAASTNTLLKTQTLQGAPEGTAIFADRQTGGRGRMGRTFQSPGGMGIYLSVLLRPNCPPQELMHLTCAVAVAAADAVEETCGFRPGIKWINDLVVDGKKLGGILTELVLNPKTGLAEGAVIGIGLNCRQRAADFDESIRSMACSVEMVTGKPLDREALAAALVNALWSMELSDKAGIMARYRQDCITLGKEVSILRGDSVGHGKTIALDDNGGLLVEFSDGHRETVNSGEVSIRGLYGYL